MNSLVKGSSERIYMPELDGLRFFAFLLVFIHHHELFSTIPYLSKLYTNGWVGVDLFFVLSAFLFTKLLIVEHERTNSINFKKFYLRRIFRIWPIYFLYIGLIVGIYFFINGAISNYIFLRILGLFTFSDNIISAINGYNPLPCSGHLWTITYEEQFYIFIPIVISFLVRASIKTRLISLFTIFLIFNLIRLVMIANNAPHPAIWVLPVTHFESMVLGIAIGFGAFNFLLKYINPLVIGAIGILFYILLGFLPHIDHISYWLILSYSLVGLSTSMILFSVLNSNRLKEFFSLELFVFLGKRSYGLYMYHLLGRGLGNYAAIHVPESFGPLTQFLCSLAFTIIAAIISYRIIETPFLKLKKKFEVVISRPI